MGSAGSEFSLGRLQSSFSSDVSKGRFLEKGDDVVAAAAADELSGVLGEDTEGESHDWFGSSMSAEGPGSLPEEIM